jgi:NAD(P)-dependent dehydrogenase (short-subunit alcohol dehydrogenase family)
MSYSWNTTGQQAAEQLRAQIKDKVVLVTGVSPKAVGTETVRVLAPYAKTIIVASRSKQRVDEALEPVRRESPSADIRFVSLDLTSETSIRAAAREVLALNLPINMCPTRKHRKHAIRD